MIGASTVATLLTALVTIEIAQLAVMAANWWRVRHNRTRLDALLNALGVDHDDGPTYDVDPEDLRGGP